MCLLTVFPAGQVVTDEHRAWLANGCDRNPDGFGWALVAGDTILTGHHMLDDKAVEEFCTARAEHPDGPALFHSRIGTAGLNNRDNTHPFFLRGDPDSGMVLAHNGILPAFFQPSKGDLRSDTRIFAEDFLRAELDWGAKRHRVAGALDAPAFRRYLRKTILATDKMAFLTIDPRYRKRLYILNADLGSWDKGVWWSNSSYKPFRYSAGYAWGADAARSYTLGAATGRTWRKNSRGIWETVWDEADGVNDLECPSCFTIGSVDLITGACKWCYVCTGCRSWATPCRCEADGTAEDGADRPPVTYLDQLTDEQLENMTDEDFQRYLDARMTS